MKSVKKNLIAGEWLEGEGAIENRNPSDVADLIGNFAQASQEQPGGISAGFLSVMPDNNGKMRMVEVIDVFDDEEGEC